MSLPTAGTPRLRFAQVRTTLCGLRLSEKQRAYRTQPLCLSR